MPRTGLSSEELVEKALAIAMDKIRHHGLDKFRLVDIARELGVSHAALYNHFPDKAALLDAISERWLRAIDEALDAIAGSDLPPSRAIIAWFEELHRRKRDKVRLDPELFKSFNLASESNKPFVARHLRNLHEQLSRLVRAAMAAGELDVASAAVAVAVLFEATLPFHHPSLVLERKDEERTELLRRVVEVVLAGLSAVK